MSSHSIELPSMARGDEAYRTYSSPSNGPGNIPQAGNDHSNKLSEPNKQSGIFGASSNLVNSIVGAGIIGIPYALSQSGLLAGLFLLGLVAYLTDKSLRIIVGLASFHPALKNRDVRTFEDLAAFPFGKIGLNFILLNMFVAAYGAMVAYLLIIKDTVPSIVGVDENDRLIKTLIMIATSATIMLPLSMQRDMASLSITSLFSVLADVVLVGFIVTYAPMSESVANAGGLARVIVMDSVKPTIFIGLGILSTAMACQHSAFIVSGSLRNKTMSRWAKVTGYSIGISAILCTILGVAGFLGFMDETAGDVLNNFDHDSLIADVARGLLAITMFFTYPMESFVARHVLIQLLHDGDMDGRDDPKHSGATGEEAGGLLFMNRRQSLTLGIYVTSLLPALLVDDLGPVLSITGSIGGGCIAYMAPGLVYLGVNGDAFLLFANGLLSRPNTAGTGVTTADLPVAGDASNIMSTESSTNTFYGIRKPCWWYLCGFPAWTYIAEVGRSNMNRKVNNEEVVFEANAYDEETMLPNSRDFCVAIFFVCFGVVTMIAGVGSNIYVQLNRN